MSTPHDPFRKISLLAILGQRQDLFTLMLKSHANATKESEDPTEIAMHHSIIVLLEDLVTHYKDLETYLRRHDEG